MICAWCYQPADDTMISNHHGETVHTDCAYTAVGIGVDRNDREYRQWLGMTGEELDD